MAKEKAAGSKKKNEEEAVKDDKAATSPVMPLFYKKPVPLDAKAHANLALGRNFNFKFTETVNAVPVNMIEMPQICHFYPIAFSTDENATPVALIGVRDNENLFVDEKGNWLRDTYIPAYIRRYPFIFSEIPGSEQLTLCVDIEGEMISEDGDQKFFEEDSKPSQLSENALEFCKSYHAAAQQTLEFSKALAASDILVDRQAEIKVGDDKKINFSGFKIIDEQKLHALDDKVFLEWRKKGWLPFLYAHLFSGGQWQRLTQLLNERMSSE